MSISEKIELLGKGIYKDIPDVLTLTSIPTSSELDYVGSEDFDATMLETILPQAIEENIDCKQLLEIDYQWICRCLRILNYGPYHTTNAIFCDSCGSASYGEYQVDLNTVECRKLPDGFINDLVVTKEEFIDFNGDIHFRMPTIQQMLNAQKDKAFQNAGGKVNRDLARLSYMITSIGSKKNLTPVEIKLAILKDLSPADYRLFRMRVSELTDFGLRAGGTAACPKCHNPKGAFIALVDDRYFRPTVGDLRKWKDDRSSRKD